ncbi:hypothetical protein R1flu_020452 [Riccia fluitans]|uniref:Myb/SANT-like DNA-binding domain-containing protein n=1 Tax=Riccia fluitans TaxID=41844 RepID=A0ABD1ZQB1_9MARC
MIMALIDIMKEKHHRVEQEPDRARKESDRTKFDRVRDCMKERGIQLKSGQLRAKWTWLQSNYKKVADHNDKLGCSPYHKMSKQDIKKNINLLDKFPEQWYNLMDTFERRRAVMDRDCAISSSEPLMPPLEPQDVPRSGSGATFEQTARSNSGKRKRDASRSASILVEALDQISQRQVEAHIEVEKSRKERAGQKHEWLQGLNESKQAWLAELEEKCQQRADVGSKDLVTVLAGMVSILGDIAKSRRPGAGK